MHNRRIIFAQQQIQAKEKQCEQEKKCSKVMFTNNCFQIFWFSKTTCAIMKHSYILKPEQAIRYRI